MVVKIIKNPTLKRCDFLGQVGEVYFCLIGGRRETNDYCLNPTSGTCEVIHKGTPFSRLEEIRQKLKSKEYRGEFAVI